MTGSGLEGKTLGPYRVIAQIGVGGMAKIYKAYQPAMDRTVALKVLPEEYAQEPQFVERFTQEARTIAQLEHRNILPVYDFGEQDGVAYLVMRFLDGGTLKELMNRRRLSLPETADMLVQVCAALDYAHRRGIVHRDVKPSNVMIDREGAVYLSDFGIAKVLESASHLTQTGAALGTPAYMSPEQCTGSPVDNRSDIYSLGVVLYEMTVGRVPFQADTPMAVLLAHLHEPLPMPRSINPEIPEALQNVILKAMAKEPGDRYQTAAGMGAALSRATPPKVVEPAAEPRPATTTQPAKPEPAEPEPAAEAQPVVPAPAGPPPPSEALPAPGTPVLTQVEEPLARPQTTAPPKAGAETAGAAKEPQIEAAEEPAVPASPPAGAGQAGPALAPEPRPELQAAVSAPQPAAALPPVELPAGETVVRRGGAVQKEPAFAKPAKKRLALAVGLGLAAVLGVAGLAGGLFLLLRGPTNLPTPFAAVDTATQAPQPTQTFRPGQTSSPRPADTLRPAPTPRPTEPPPPQPALFDDFENPAFEGKLNPDLWEVAGPPDCLAVQTRGVLSLGNRVSSSQMDCTIGIKIPGQDGLHLPSMQASLRVAPNPVGKGAWTALIWTGNIPAAGNAPPGDWRVECGVSFNGSPRLSMDITDARMGSDLAHQIVYYMDAPMPPDAWTPLRLQVEPETMTFSCWMGDQLVGMYNPVSEQETLKKAGFHPSLIVIRPPGSGMTVEVSELAFVPAQILPRAAEAAQPEPGCIRPPKGIVGWWTGDGSLKSLVAPGPGGGEGAWGFAKGMVGQAFAFQNFPNRGGLMGFPPYPALQNLQTVSVEGWVRLNVGPFKRIDRFLTLGGETLVIRHDGNVKPGTLHFFMKIDGQLHHVWSQRLMKAGEFYHVAGTYDGKTMKLYLNGVLVNSLPVKGQVATSDGGMMLSGGETLDGLLDEFTLYNRALAGEEIQAIYQAGAAGKCRP